ncbi:GP46-like surface antigen, putative, partial [Bodo saltans]
LSGTIPPGVSATLLLVDVQDNTQLSGAVPPKLTLFGSVVICNTNMTCPSSTYPTLYCFPANFTFDSLDIVALSIAAAPYKVACTTPSPPPIRPPLSVNNFTRSVSFSLTQPMAVTQPYDALHTSSNAAAAMMYATLVTSGGVVGRGAVPSVQRAANALRLTALCQQLDNTADTNAANPVPCSDLSDYPLGAPIPVGDEMLGLAAGAAVLNLLLVLVISVGLHVCGVLQHCMNVAAARKHDKGSASKTTSCSPAVWKLLPSSNLPGAIAIAYGVLFQPSLGASITLLAFTGCTARSVVCGVAMLCAWAVFPLYCVYEVVWRGRDCGVFVLESVSQRDHGDAHGDQPVLQWWNRLRHRVMSPQREWRAPRTHNFGGDGAANNQRVVFLLRNMEPVYGGYVGGREWFFIVEWCVTAAGGVV